MRLIIRGHVRNSLGDARLRDLVWSLIGRRPEIRIYVHSWNTVQSSLSWRKMHEDNTSVSEEMIFEYLDCADNLVRIEVEDDRLVSIPGRVDGTVASTPCPIKGYKLMFYGMLKGSEYVMEDGGRGDIALQTRFDILSGWARMDAKRILDFLDDIPSEDEPIRFLIRPGTNKLERDLRFDRWLRYGAEYEPHWTLGVENVFSAKAEDMNGFLKHMYENFDEIESRYKGFNHQEWIPMFEAFGGRWISSRV